MSGDSIGMMEGAFFVGRGELIQWVNELLEVNVTKVEQCATGAIYAQILDAIYIQEHSHFQRLTGKQSMNTNL